MLPYACLQEIVYILKMPIALRIIRELNTCFNPKVEVTSTNTLLFDSVLLSVQCETIQVQAVRLC